MKLLFIGDVVGETGCLFLQKKLPELKYLYQVDIAVVNGENSAVGNGITKYSSKQIFRAGADIITTGNHAFQRKNELDLYENEFIIRPANYSNACPGKGFVIYDMGICQIAMINLSGVLFLENLDNPFTVIDNLLEQIQTPNIFIDFHAEATSEKRAMGFYLAGRVTAVLGTHTHVQTADACILEHHTGYITDTGMTGVENSVLGINTQNAIDRLRLHAPIRYREAKGNCYLNAVLIDFDNKCGKCTKITPIIMR
ncbi:MAG: TIGR00282 family metallophosphoesterase [Oscillospiraceae bacterium]|nr:TIGR00282 family metallophosphoesterase [Ruminococcus sp.]MDE6707190.1 TIGR00282 family metallophosphoesterase [Oscillospiraceae bacterium]